jgi:predicted NACHT family NTPase
MPRRQDDEFRGPTKTLLGRAVAYHCSRPECERLTICANEAGDGTINIGVASHITAAAPGGPRYDSLLSHEQRRHASNGIWLCQNCGKLVDSDESQYTTDQLREWKKNAETKTRSEVARSHRYQTDLDWSASLDEDDLRQVAQLGLADEDTIDRVIERLNASARRDIDAFMGQTRWPLHPVELGLRTDGIDQPLTTAGLANLLELTRSLSIVSAPGTGKSTTLIQLASTLLDDQRQVGLIVPLAAWAAESVSILKWVTERSAFHGVRVEHLMLLAVHGRLTLLLDGWNELDSKARQRLIFQIDELERDYPLLRLVVSTRRQRTDVPVGGAEVRLDLLSYSQQLEIARARRGQDGEAL